MADSTHGLIQFHQWIGDNWAVLFSHPKDFTPVCTTELGALAGLEGEFAKRGAKIIGLSVDPVENHAKWAVDIQDVTGNAVNLTPSSPAIPCSSGTSVAPTCGLRWVGQPTISARIFTPPSATNC
jgi:hypothetical protein